MEKIYYIDSLIRTIKTLTFFNTEDILLNHRINISQLEEVGKIGCDTIFKVKSYNYRGFMFKKSVEKFYGDFLIGNKSGQHFTSSSLSVMELYYNIDFFAQPALPFARVIKKEGYNLSDNINIIVAGREMTLYVPMLLSAFKFYPIHLQSEILDFIQKYENNMLSIDEMFKEIFLSISYYYMRERGTNRATTKTEMMKVSGL